MDPQQEAFRRTFEKLMSKNIIKAHGAVAFMY